MKQNANSFALKSNKTEPTITAPWDLLGGDYFLEYYLINEIHPRPEGAKDTSTSIYTLRVYRQMLLRALIGQYSMHRRDYYVLGLPSVTVFISFLSKGLSRLNVVIKPYAEGTLWSASCKNAKPKIITRWRRLK